MACLPLTRVAKRRAGVNDSPVDCQSREVTESQREVDFCEAKRRRERKVKYYPSVGYRRQLPWQGEPAKTRNPFTGRRWPLHGWQCSKRRTCAQLVMIRAMPYNAKPPAMRVDFYFENAFVSLFQRCFSKRQWQNFRGGFKEKQYAI